MKHILYVLKLFFIGLYNFLVGLPEVYDVEVKDFPDEALGEHCTEYGTLTIRPLQKALYDFIIRSSDGKKEKYAAIALKVQVAPHGFLTLSHDKKPILHGKAVKADDGSFMIKGPGYFKTKTLEANDLLFFERIWDMPFDV